MIKTKTSNKFFIFGILIFSIFLVSACGKSSTNINADNNLNINNNQSITINQEEFEEQYQSSIQDILKPYWQNSEVVGIKDKIIALKAPAKYIDLHIGLVISFEKIEQGQTNFDQAKIEEGFERIAELKTKYSWLDKN